MRWNNLSLDPKVPEGEPGGPAQGALFGAGEVVTRTVDTPEFRGMTFYEVRARSVLNKVPSASRMPFGWTINPYRGCGHGCTYCFARNTHTYLDLDSGDDFDRRIVVKVNAVQRLRAELAHPRWQREHVAMGTNTDPYQRAEGRYRLMPGIIRALRESGTPFSILTKGTLLGRDLAELRAASADVDVGLGMSIAHLDPTVHRLIEPGTPSPRARLDLVRRLSDAGLSCGVFVAPVLPWITDSTDQLDHLLGQIAAAGASGATVLALHLRPGAREWFLSRLARDRPDLLPRYERLYARGSNADPRYRRWLADRAGPLLRRHGLDRSRHRGADTGSAGPVEHREGARRGAEQRPQDGKHEPWLGGAMPYGPRQSDPDRGEDVGERIDGTRQLTLL